jgi:hydroxyacylglutathione hydrolase
LKNAIIRRLVVGPLQANCYLFSSRDGLTTAIIDPGGDAEIIIACIEENDLQPVCIIDTHGHPDHTAANAVLKERYGIPLFIHKNDASMLAKSNMLNVLTDVFFDPSPPPDRLLNDGEEIEIGREKLKVVHTPGHSPGSICLLYENAGDRIPVLFSGDTVFEGSVGRADLPGGSYEVLIHSLTTRIIPLPPRTRILPGHGPETSLKKEKESNPFFISTG